MGKLLAGAAVANITPPLGTHISGYYHTRLAQGVHDELWARALCLTDGGRAIALVSVDLIGMPAAMTHAAKERITTLTGGDLRPEQVLIGCTHSHTAPSTGDEPMFPVHAAYLEVAIEKIADAAVMAYRRLAPAELAWGVGQVEGISFNRRFWMRSPDAVPGQNPMPSAGRHGLVVTNPGIGNPDILRPAGPVDTELAVISVRNRNGKPLALWVNYAVHLDTTGGDEISADYPYYLAEALRRQFGPDLVVLFNPATMGDLNHLDVHAAGRPIKGQSHPARIGTALAGEAIRILSGAVYRDELPIAFAHSAVELPLRQVTPEAGVAAERLIERTDIGTADFTLELVAAWRDRMLAGMGQSLATEVQAFRIGDAAVVGLPGEVFVELGMAIKAGSPVQPTFVAELVSDSVGYLPTRKAYDEGGYEVTATIFAPGAGEMLVEVAVELMQSLG